MTCSPFRTGLLATAVLLCTGGQVASAADTPGGFSFLGSLIQMFAALAIVIGLILLMYYAANKWLRVLSPAGTISKYIRILETRHLAPKQALVLVEISGEYLLVGSSPAGVHLVKQIDMLEEIDVIEEPLARLWQIPAADRFRTLLAERLQRKTGGASRQAPGAQP